MLARIALVALLLPSCLSGPVDPEAPAEVVAKYGADCLPSQCGEENSPVIAGVLFWKLHPTAFTPNEQGVFIESVEDVNGAPMVLRTPFPGDRLRGVRIGDGTFVDHANLLGTKIHLRVQGRPFLVTIDGVTPTHQLVPFWIDPLVPRIEMYEFRYFALDGLGPTNATPLCTPEDKAVGTEMIRAVVFGRDVYNAEKKTISFDGSPAGWFNIACEGGAPYKMHMIGYTQAAQNQLTHTTSAPERRAMLKAWSGDYCGKGKAFTRHGEKITLHEIHDLLPPTSGYVAAKTVSIDAVWGPDGAKCIDVPRLTDSDPDILSRIAEECPLPPPCSPTLPAGVVTTGNPPPPLLPIVIAP